MATIQATLKLYQKTSKLLAGFNEMVEVGTAGFEELREEVQRSTDAFGDLREGVEAFGKELKQALDGLGGFRRSCSATVSAQASSAGRSAEGPGAALAGMIKTMGIGDAVKSIQFLFKPKASAKKDAAGGGAGGVTEVITRTTRETTSRLSMLQSSYERESERSSWSSQQNSSSLSGALGMSLGSVAALRSGTALIGGRWSESSAAEREAEERSASRRRLGITEIESTVIEREETIRRTSGGGQQGGEGGSGGNQKGSQWFGKAVGMMGSGLKSMVSWGLQSEALAQMPMGEVGVMQEQIKKLQDTIGVGLYPAIQAVAGIFTQILPVVTQLAVPLVAVINKLAQGAAWLADKAFQVAAVFADNWSWIGPIVLGVISAIGAFLLITKGAALAVTIFKGIMAAFSLIQTVVSIGFGVLTGSTGAASAAMTFFNSTLAACPLTWILVLLIAVVAIFYSIIGLINKITGSSISATGLICAALAGVFAFIVNIILAVYNFIIDQVVLIYNLIADFVNFLANVFNDPIGAIVRLFSGLIDFILEGFESVASVIDTITGSKMADSIHGLRDYLDHLTVDLVGEGEVVMEHIVREDDMAGKRIAYGEIMKSTYHWGDEKETGFKEWMNNLFKSPEIPGAGNGAYASASASASDYAMAQEDMTYMRDIAEREAINRYATTSITIHQNNENHITKDVDLDGITDAWTMQFAEKLDVSAEGVFA